MTKKTATMTQKKTPRNHRSALFIKRRIAMRYNSNYFATCLAKLSFRSTVRLNTKWPGLESSLSRQK